MMERRVSSMKDHLRVCGAVADIIESFGVKGGSSPRVRSGLKEASDG